MRNWPRRALLIAGIAALLTGAIALAVNSRAPRVGAAGAAPNLRVSGASLVDAANAPVFLHGVNYSGGEYACIQGWGIFDGPSDQTFVNGLLSARVNAIRLPMNEDCWLGINGVPAAYSGANYQNAFISFVNLLTKNGITPELDLQWNAPGSQRATGTKAMPDADHSGAFWQSVARTFAGRTDIIFDLYNEPHPSSWTIWRDGGMDSGFNTIGMQALVTIVRNAGFHGVLSLSGIDYANTLGATSGWLAYKPNDPDNNLAAAVHVYKGNYRQTTSAWNSDFGPVAAKIPLINNELGAYCYDDSCVDPSLASQFWAWLASAGGDGTMAWTWDTWGTVEALVSNYSGPALTSWGQQVKNQYATYTGGGQSGPTPTTPPAPPTATATTPPAPPTPTSAPTTPPTNPPSTPTPIPPVPPTPTVNPAPSNGLTPAQASSRFINYAANRANPVRFSDPIHSGRLLVAVVGVAGGNPYVVDRVTDTLGNTWTRAVSGVNGDNSDVEIWYTNSVHAGTDGVTVSLKALPGVTSRWVQTYVTVAEFSGRATFHEGKAASSSRQGTHSSGAFASATGDLIVGGYADAGYVGALGIADGKQALGPSLDEVYSIQAIQSFGTASGASSSMTYSNDNYSRAEVAGASFTPAP